jgi:uncharacterized membrane protein YbhN (UPF0104 family)
VWVAVLRCAITIVILAILVYCISPAKILAALAACDWRWLMGALVLMPPFLVARVVKWYLLVRQIKPSVGLGRIISSYLWGMAVGLVTPGRVGELARIKAAALPTRFIGLFLLEKALELTTVIALCLLALFSLGLFPSWFLFMISGVLIFFLAWWKRFMKLAIRLPYWIAGWPSLDKLEGFDWAISRLKIASCGLLSLFCQIIFCLQCYLVLNSMGERYEILVVRFIPLVFLANFLPITIGGVGLRETVGVFLLSKEGIPAEVVIPSFLIVSAVDLFFPAVIGAALHVLRPARRGA